MNSFRLKINTIFSEKTKMDILALLLGAIAGAAITSLGNLIVIVRIILTMITSYFIVSIFYVNIHLWEYKEYTNDNLLLLVNSNYFWLLITINVLIFAIFYWIVPAIIDSITNNKTELYIRNTYNKLLPTEQNLLYDYFKKWFTKIFVVLLKLRLIRPTQKIGKNDRITYMMIAKTTQYWFAMVLHGILCILIMPISIYGLIPMALICVFLTAYILLQPTVLFVLDLINQIRRKEINKIVR